MGRSGLHPLQACKAYACSSSHSWKRGVTGP